MTWQGIEGHDDVVTSFQRALARGRLASTFLFLGPEGIGKRSFAIKLAQALLCPQSPLADLRPCGSCPSCAQVQAGTHPDLHLVTRPPEKNVIPVDVFIGQREKRGQEGLCHDISLKPLMGGRRVAILDDADYLAVEGANALLKTLEEPPPNSVLILIGTSGEKQLPTIRSRCQNVFFQPLNEAVLARLLVQQGIVDDQAGAQRLAPHAGGSLTAARELANKELWEFRARLLSSLARQPMESVALSAETAAFVDAAGKEAPPRRARARQVIAFAEDFYCQLHRSLSGISPIGDDQLRRSVDTARQYWRGGAEAAADCSERCLDALEHIDRNANLINVLTCWLDNLKVIAFSGPMAGAT